MRISLYLSVAVSIFLISGCSHIGPKYVHEDRFSYNQAIADSWNEQTLLNIVRLRYLEMPLFLDVSSVVSGYTLESSVNVGGSLPSSDPNTFSLGSSGKFTDRPTITYSPITGQQFNKKLMTPIPPGALLFLMQAGWPSDLIFPVTCDSMNGLNGRITGGMNARTETPEFKRAVTLLRDIQQSGVVGMHIKESDHEEQHTLMIFRRDNIAPEVEEKLKELVLLLHLQPGVSEIMVSYGNLNIEDDQIALLTRSMLQILIELSSQIDVPAEHDAEGRCVPSMLQGQPDEVSDRLIRIHSGLKVSDDAFVKVKFRDHWFWIDDRDLRSKRIFTFVMILFSLTETGGQEVLPMVTIPAG